MPQLGYGPCASRLLQPHVLRRKKHLRASEILIYSQWPLPHCGHTLKWAKRKSSCIYGLRCSLYRHAVLTPSRPDITVTFLRTSTLPATWARFKVPLTFNKLDIRDYLFHAYGVRVLRVRSYVEQQKVIMKGRRWRRPQAKKFMTVEMDRPFVWPEPPTDLSPYVHVTMALKSLAIS